MDLQVNRHSQLTIHVQLKAQLSHLIQAGQLAPGTQLPTVRQLAGFLRINRNTAARVFADLEREGYLSCEKGRGTFVAQRLPGKEGSPPRMSTLAKLVDETPEPARKLKALFTECNRPQLRRFSQELAETLPLEVDALLISDLEREYRRS